MNIIIISSFLLPLETRKVDMKNVDNASEYVEFSFTQTAVSLPGGGRWDLKERRKVFHKKIHAVPTVRGSPKNPRGFLALSAPKLRGRFP